MAAITPDTPVAPSPLRRDAERNRQRVIVAAQELFAARGVGVGFNDIARHAGVAVGTVYRRFPDKRDLIALALHDQLDALVAVFDECLAAEDAWAGFTSAVHQAIAMNVANRGLREVAFASSHGRAGVDALQEGLAPRLRELLARAQAEGPLRADVTPADLIMLMLMLTEFAQRSAAVKPDAYRRYLDLTLDALRRPPPGTPSLPDPISDDDAQAIARAWSPSAD